MDDPIFSIELAPRESSAAQSLGQALGAEVAAEFGPRDERSFALLARGASGDVVGGVNGVIHWRWLYVAQFYVAPQARGVGLGGALLARAQDFACENNCVGIYLDTFSASACAYYQRRGFVVTGRIDNFPPGASRVFLTKSLSLSPLAGRGRG